MERKHFLELCQANTVYPNSVVVRYDGTDYYPVALKIWFNSAGETQDTAVLLDKNSRCIVECRIQEVECLDKEA